MSSSTDLMEASPLTPDFQQRAHDYFNAMRDQHAVFDAPGCDLHLVTRHDLITPIVRDIETFSNEFGQVAEPCAGQLDRRLKEIATRGWPFVPTLLTLDPPRHDRYRASRRLQVWSGVSDTRFPTRSPDWRDRSASPLIQPSS